MMTWLIRFLSVATKRRAKRDREKNARPADAATEREWPLVVDDNTAMAELTRLLELQTRIDKSRTKKGKTNSDPEPK
jgi:hypothetical protein